MEPEQYLTVTALNKYLGFKFKADPYLRRVYLSGEISNFRFRKTHQYFSLKDANSKIDAVMFKHNFQKINFTPKDGMKVLAIGKIVVYEPYGRCQINIDSMQVDGLGSLYQAYEQLKQKLYKEGVFSKHKRNLVRFPKRIAVITSSSGAVIHDIWTTIQRRYPVVEVVLFPADVQGDNAKDSLVRRLTQVNEDGNFDTIIIGRGGGSIEDLWPFNEEIVARAISDSQIPVISSVGHETDTTLSDLASDKRAATPTAAAELATPVLSEVIMQLNKLQMSLISSIKKIVKQKELILNKVNNNIIFIQPERIYEGYYQKLDSLKNRLTRLINQNVSDCHRKYDILDKKFSQIHFDVFIQKKIICVKQLCQKLITKFENKLLNKQRMIEGSLSFLENLNPLNIMDRGFIFVTDDKNNIIKSVDQLSCNGIYTMHFKNGMALVQIKNKRRDT